MRKLKLIFISALIGGAVLSCSKEECYTCTTESKITSGGITTTSKVNNEFCGTKSEIDDYEKSGTNSSTSGSGLYTVTTETVTTCR